MAASRALLLFGLVLGLCCISISISTSMAMAMAVAAKEKAPISSNSVLVALLDSQYSSLAELVEKAAMLQVLEETVTSGTAITLFAPNNSFLDRGLDPDFRRFLHEPGNVASLQRLLQFHVLPHKIPARKFKKTVQKSLGSEKLSLAVGKSGELTVDLGVVTQPDAVVRPDGIIHGIDRVLVPKSVQDDFSHWRSRRIVLEAVKPEGAPSFESKSLVSSGSSSASSSSKSSAKKSEEFVPKHSIFYAMGPGPASAPAPAPGPGTGKHFFDGEAQVKDFIHTLLHYGGYSEMADILVNLTSLASEMAKLVSEGYRLTVLAPNDEAMGRLTPEHLSDPGAPEKIVYYHMIPEYQTEESFYTSVRRFGKVSYETLLLPHKMLTQEADGTVQFGEGNNTAHLYDHDIYTDGRISVQGIDKVLLPPEEEEKEVPGKGHAKRRLVEGDEQQTQQTRQQGPARGRFMGAVCQLVENFNKNLLMSACN